jgi:cyclic nucleotide-binding protein
VRIEGSATAISWIPSEAVTGLVYRLPFDLGVSHYDDPPPDRLPGVPEYLARDGARFANVLRAWIEVRDGEVVDHGQTGLGHIGSTTLRPLGPARELTFAACALPDLQHARRLGPASVRFEQTAGGRTGVPAPRRVSRRPYVQLTAPLAWSSLALTLHADGRQEVELTGASPFPRHWVYDGDGSLIYKSATIDYREWSASAFGKQSPWGGTNSPAVVSAVETALERELSLRIMRGGARPEIRRLAADEVLTRQGDAGTELFLLLDGVLRVDVDGRPLTELGPGAVLGERALLEPPHVRTATVTALTPTAVAVATAGAIDLDALRELATGHRREELL